MKVLFVTYDFPYPTNSGGKNRAYHLLKHTAKKAEVYLFSYVRGDYNPEFNQKIFDLNIKQIKIFKRKKVFSIENISSSIFSTSSIFKSLYYDKRFEEEIIRFIKEQNIDVLHLESTYAGYFITEKIKKTKVKIVLGTENIEYELYKDLARYKKSYIRPLINIQADRLREEELLMVKNADEVTTITIDEAEVLKKLTSKKCHIVANGIEPDVYDFQFDEKLKNNILFVGNFSYFPNVDAINYFLKDIFPSLSRDITLTVVGKNCTRIVKNEDQRIIKKEFVVNIIDEYRGADIMVFPIRIGGGTNFKVLEAMSLGLPIVANPDRMSGLKALEEKHFLKAINGDEYKRQIKRLYSDSILRKKITTNARVLVEKNFSWESIGQDLLTVWKK